ncbi:MAG: uroporphyrinogen decarboxylase family protein [Arenicellales bacterium]|jgi:uroporphyrinogen decarboxylase|nr:uroporphyrinogen decarboxylase family protein [Arenicellales bacterium]|tara:strand:- start:1111 stop:2247 length:1137 start_codon:yes stop_codon:yes gene_type:complete
MTMSRRERILAALNRQQPDRVPIDLGGTYASTVYFTAYEKLKRHMGLEHETELGMRRARVAIPDLSMLDYFDVDTRLISLSSYEGGLQRDIDEDNFVDEWGAVWGKTGDGPYLNVGGPFQHDDITLAEVENHDWPDPDNPGLYRGFRKRAQALREASDHAIILNIRLGVVHEAQFVRGYSKWLVDLYRRPEIASRLMEFGSHFCAKVAETALAEAGEFIDIVFFGDDMSTQQTTVFSPDIYRQMIKPHQAMVIGRVKKAADVKVVFHCCGAIADLIDDLAEIGVDAINPVQVAAKGMEPERLKRDFGDKMAFWGGVDTQRVMPQCNEDEVRQETRHIIDTLGRGGGLVLTAVHNIQPDVPPANVLAMYNEARLYGGGA